MVRVGFTFFVIVFALSSLGQTSDISLNCPDSIQVSSLDVTPEPFNYLTELIYAGGSVTSICDINQSSFKLKSETSDSLLNNITIKRTYQINDLCGNQGTCSHIIATDNITKSGFSHLPNFTFSVKPNPSDGVFEISLNSTSIKDLSVRIIDTFGRTIKSKSITSTSCNHIEKFDLSQYGKGFYYVILSTPEEYVSNTIIIR